MAFISCVVFIQPPNEPSDIALTLLQDVVRCEEENHREPEATAAVHQNHLKAVHGPWDVQGHGRP